MRQTSLSLVDWLEWCPGARLGLAPVSRVEDAPPIEPVKVDWSWLAVRDFENMSEADWQLYKMQFGRWVHDNGRVERLKLHPAVRQARIKHYRKKL